MFLTCLMLAISSSIDSFGIGITYGIKNTKITLGSKFVLFIISLFIATLSITVGKIIDSFLPTFICNLIGFLILIFMGIWIILQSFKSPSRKSKKHYNKKIYSFFIKSLGITIKIIKNPINSDLDNSEKIEAKEALYLGLALSLDSLCIGIGNSMIGATSFIFPLLVATFQLIFLSFGLLFGKKINTMTNIPDNIWSIISGILLICIGISKLI